jgi:hypothetical protein
MPSKKRAPSGKAARKPSPYDAALAKVRAIFQGLPEIEEEPFGEHVTFRVRKKVVAYLLDNHHGDGRLAVWFKAPPGAQAMLVESDPDRYFVPPYVGHRGWVGAIVSGSPDWATIGAGLEEAFRLTAPKRLLGAM